MSGQQRYQRVSDNDDDNSPTSPAFTTPSSPPPSFRSRASSPQLRSTNISNNNSSSNDAHARSPRSDEARNLADTFGADGSDSDEENDGDDRQRLMRGTPPQQHGTTTTTSSSSSSSSWTTVADTTTAQQHARADSADGSGRAVVERRVTRLPVFATQQQHQQQAPTAAGRRVYGGGSGSDGVFANLNAKPESGEKLEEHPPTYEQAAADAAPPYWETTILAPGLGGLDEVYVEGLPVGSVFSFIWNGMISVSFQLVGFLLTYLLHTTHAAKNGSRAGLGITLVQYGFYMKGAGGDGGGGGGDAGSPPAAAPTDASGATTYGAPADPDAHSFDPQSIAAEAAAAAAGGGGGALGGLANSDWLAYALMIVGWFILIRAVTDFLKARRHEQLVLQSPDRGLGVPVIATGEQSETVV